LRNAYYFGVTLLGLSVGWFVGELAPFDRTGARLDTGTTWVVAAAAGVVFLAVAAGHSRLMDWRSTRARSTGAEPEGADS
jgi:hypothetical protein